MGSYTDLLDELKQKSIYDELNTPSGEYDLYAHNILNNYKLSKGDYNPFAVSSGTDYSLGNILGNISSSFVKGATLGYVNPQGENQTPIPWLDFVGELAGQILPFMGGGVLFKASLEALKLARGSTLLGKFIQEGLTFGAISVIHKDTPKNAKDMMEKFGEGFLTGGILGAGSFKSATSMSEKLGRSALTAGAVGGVNYFFGEDIKGAGTNAGLVFLLSLFPGGIKREAINKENPILNLKASYLPPEGKLRFTNSIVTGGKIHSVFVDNQGKMKTTMGLGVNEVSEIEHLLTNPITYYKVNEQARTKLLDKGVTRINAADFESPKTSEYFADNYWGDLKRKFPDTFMSRKDIAREQLGRQHLGRSILDIKPKSLKKFTGKNLEERNKLFLETYKEGNIKKGAIVLNTFRSNITDFESQIFLNRKIVDKWTLSHEIAHNVARRTMNLLPKQWNQDFRNSIGKILDNPKLDKYIYSTTKENLKSVSKEERYSAWSDLFADLFGTYNVNRSKLRTDLPEIAKLYDEIFQTGLNRKYRVGGLKANIPDEVREKVYEAFQSITERSEKPQSSPPEILKKSNIEIFKDDKIPYEINYSTAKAVHNRYNFSIELFRNDLIEIYPKGKIYKTPLDALYELEPNLKPVSVKVFDKAMDEYQGQLSSFHNRSKNSMSWGELEDIYKDRTRYKDYSRELKINIAQIFDDYTTVNYRLTHGGRVDFRQMNKYASGLQKAIKTVLAHEIGHEYAMGFKRKSTIPGGIPIFQEKWRDVFSREMYADVDQKAYKYIVDNYMDMFMGNYRNPNVQSAADHLSIMKIHRHGLAWDEVFAEMFSAYHNEGLNPLLKEDFPGTYKFIKDVISEKPALGKVGEPLPERIKSTDDIMDTDVMNSKKSQVGDYLIGETQYKKFDDLLSEFDNKKMSKILKTFFNKEKIEDLDYNEVKALVVATIRTGGNIHVSNSLPKDFKFTDIENFGKVDIFDNLLDPSSVFKRHGLWKAIGKETFDHMDNTERNISRSIDWLSDLRKKAGKDQKTSEALWSFHSGNPAVNMTQPMHEVILEVRNKLTEYVPFINQVRKELDLPPIEPNKIYLPHLLTDLMKIYVQKKYPIPEELLKSLEYTVPMKKFVGFVLPRTANLPFKKDYWNGLATYISSMENKKMLDSLLPKIKPWMQFLPPTTYEYMKWFIDKELMGRPNNYEILIDNGLFKVTQTLFGNKKEKLPPEIANQIGELEVEVPNFKFKSRAGYRMVSNYKRLNYVSLIGMNLRTLLINLTQPIGTAAKLEGGFSRTFQDMAYGYTQVIGKMFDKKVWRELKEEGILVNFDNVFARSDFSGKFIDKVVDITMWNMKVSEFINRGSSYFAKTKNLEKVHGLMGDEAKSLARDLSNMVNFKYGKGRTPRIFATNPIGQLMYQYNTFTTKHAQLLYEMAKDAKVNELIPDFMSSLKNGTFKKYLKELTDTDRGSIMRYILYASAVSSAASVLGLHLTETFTKGFQPSFGTPGIKLLYHIATGDVEQLRQDSKGMIPAYAQMKRFTNSFNAISKGVTLDDVGRAKYKMGKTETLRYLMLGTGTVGLQKQIGLTKKAKLDFDQYMELRRKIILGYLNGDTELPTYQKALMSRFGVFINMSDIRDYMKTMNVPLYERTIKRLPLKLRTEYQREALDINK